MAIQCIKNHYYLSLGHSLNATGKRVPKKVYLGADYDAAQRKATALAAAWKNENTIDPVTGPKVWGKGTIENAIAWAVGIETKSVQVAPTKPQPTLKPVVKLSTYVPPPDSYTLKAALDDFVDWFKKRSAIEAGEKWKATVEQIMGSITSRLDTGILAMPLAAVDIDTLEELRRLVLSRPISNRIKARAVPIAYGTVINWLKVLGMAFDRFAHNPGRYHWTPPFDYMEKFQLTHSEKSKLKALYDEKELDLYTIEEVADIYHRSSPLGRKYILMAVCLGAGQEAIANLKADHFQQDEKGEYWVNRKRHKSNIKGSWWVPPELGQMMAESIARTPPNPGGLAFLSEDGQPLLHDNTDSIMLCWWRCVGEKAKKRLPFGRLRKLSGNLVQNLTGSHELAQMQLCHSLGTVAEKHYLSRSLSVGIGKTPQKRLYDAQKLLWKEIRHLFFPPVAQAKAA